MRHVHLWVYAAPDFHTKRLLNCAVMFSVQEADGLEIMLNIHIDPCFPKPFSECALVPFGKTLLILY